MSVHPKDKTSEVIGLLSLAVAALLSLALVTYNSLDSSFSVSTYPERYLNRIGKIGSVTADLLFQYIGFSAFLLPVPLLLVGYKKIRNRSIEFPFVKLLGFFTLIAGLCALLSLLSVPRPARFEFLPGGVFGTVLADHLILLLNPIGSVILTATVIVLSLLLITRFSLDKTIAWFGARDWNIFAAWAFRYREWKKRRAGHRELERVEKQPVVLKPVPRPAPTLAEVELADPPFGGGPKGKPEGPSGRTHKEIVINRDEREQERLPEPMPAHRSAPSRTKAAAYRLPPVDFLQVPESGPAVNEKELLDRSQKLVAKYAEFGVSGSVLQIHPGPVVTTFEFKPEAGVRYSRITSMADDLCLALKAESIRIDRLAGKNTVGIEVPNLSRQKILLRDIFEGPAFQRSGSFLTLGLGKLINGDTYAADLTGMPHLLLAGATGSGKSVGLNCMVCSILYKASPADVRFIMIDPKRLELGLYDGIPHLLTPIVTDPRQAANALAWAVGEMEARYKALAQLGVRNIEQYNEEIKNSRNGLAEENQHLPYIVIIVDELADLMMTAGKEVEGSLTRLAQMARAIGIHLILATQRPSVDVLTGLIKANFPCRISFRVSSKVDSRTILDCNGAERLLGQGDMLFLSPRTSRLIRVHGAYISEKEIAQVTSYLKTQGTPEYQEEILEGDEEEDSALTEMEDLEDDLYQEAARFVVETGKASTSLLQRRFRIGYGRAARLLDIMQHEGVVGAPDGSKAREVLVASNYFDEPNSN
ncbi:MAG: DNA translocase FtsK [Acidobacteria bacterium]|nr:MAG: DNA translocase FtsK [Acidobacteriota bacterium]